MDTISRAERDHVGQLLKKKMKAVKSLEHRLDRERQDLTEFPDSEEAILVGFGEGVALSLIHIYSPPPPRATVSRSIPPAKLFSVTTPGRPGPSSPFTAWACSPRTAKATGAPEANWYPRLPKEAFPP